MGKTIAKKKKRDHTTRIVADITGYSVDMVNRVREGNRNNEEIMATVVDYQIGHSNLIRHLQELIPLDRRGKNFRKL
jgi:hypothetical protein